MKHCISELLCVDYRETKQYLLHPRKLADVEFNYSDEKDFGYTKVFEEYYYKNSSAVVYNFE